MQSKVQRRSRWNTSETQCEGFVHNSKKEIPLSPLEGKGLRSCCLLFSLAPGLFLAAVFNRQQIVSQFNSLSSAPTLQTTLGLEVWGLGFSFWLCGKNSAGSLNSTWNCGNSYDPAAPIRQFPQNLSSKSLTSFWLYVLTNGNMWLNWCFSSLLLPIW